MNFGSLAGGLAEGLSSGYRTGMLADNLRNQREMEGRRMGIMEDDARQRRQANDQAIQRGQRELDREARAEQAHRDALAIVTQGLDTPYDKNAPAGSQIGSVILSSNALNDPRRIRAALDVYAKAGMEKEASEWLGHLKNAQQQNVLPALQALRGGDYEGAGRIYSQMGIKAKFSPGAAKGKYRVDYDGDGTFEERDLDIDEMSVRGYDGYVKAKQAALDAANKAETHKADIELKQADAANKRGDNPTRIRVAEIGADKERYVADARSRNKGRGRGVGGGEEEGVDWGDAKKRQEINSEIMSAAVAQYSKTKVDPTSGKKAPDEYSRNIGEKASRVYLQALKNGGDMTIESALRIANEGRVTYATKLDPSGRLMTKPGISLNGTVYDDGSVEKAATKEQVLEYLDSTRDRAVESGKTITPDMLKDVPIDKWAKQAGMKPQELVDRLVNGPKTVTESPPGRVPNQGGSGGGIISGAEAGEPGGAGAAASGRGIASASANVSKAKDLDSRISDLREKLGANQRMGNDTTGISRELQGLEAQRKGLNVSPADLIRAELQQVEAEIAKLAGGGMRGAPGRYGQVLAKKKADLERRLRGAEPTSGISREQMR